MADKNDVAIAGIVGAVAIAVTTLVFKGPDSSLLVALVGAITFIVGLVFGVKIQKS